MMPSYTAAQLLARMVEIAKRDGSTASAHGISVTPKGRYMMNGTRISEAKALEMLEAARAPRPLPEAKGQPRRTRFTWESLNPQTKALFFHLAEQIQEATRDHDMLVAVRLGHDIPKISLVDAPRLSNLKKAGLLETFEGTKKSHRMLRLTGAGRERFAAGL